MLSAKISLKKFDELTKNDQETWTWVQQGSELLWSPYFSYAFHDAVNQARSGLEVAVFYQDDVPTAFLPFRRSMTNMARPGAGPMHDLHGVIAAPETQLDLLGSSLSDQLGGYAFSSVPFDQVRHGLLGQYGDGNRVLDLRDGFEAYLANRSDASSNFRRAWKKAEKLINAPDTKIIHDVWDEDAFARLIELKQDALAGAGHFDLFSLAWPKKLIKLLQNSPSTSARGVFSRLYMGGELAAVCFCMRSEHVLHYWFPSYEPKFEKQKPGMALLFSLAQWATTQNMVEFHLGLGDVQYKRLMASYAVPVRQGTLELKAANRMLGKVSALGLQIEGQSKLLDIPAKAIRKWERVALFGTVKA